MAWLDARREGGAFLIRVEDLDRPRVVAGAEQRLLDDLRWLGLDWDEGPDVGGPFAPYRQRERAALYDAALDRLLAAGRAFPCSCSRADVTRAASAPHESDGDGDAAGPRYPGTCRGQARAQVEARAGAQGRRPAVRFDGRGEAIGFRDLVRGEIPAGRFPAGGVDDFVLRRSDGTAAYQLAVVVDDDAMEVTRVVRGDDLLASTPRQLALHRALGQAPPAFAHLPLVLAPSGARLAKRTRPLSIATLRARGADPAAVVGMLAASAGLCPPGARVSPRDLIATFSLDAVTREAAVIDIDIAALI